jgi:hypothetical protein
MTITYEMFVTHFGVEPLQDDLERANCEDTSHTFCGLHTCCGFPNFGLTIGPLNPNTSHLGGCAREFINPRYPDRYERMQGVDWSDSEDEYYERVAQVLHQ